MRKKKRQPQLEQGKQGKYGLAWEWLEDITDELLTELHNIELMVLCRRWI